ncbi:MAG: hypothetical protein Q8N53_02905 [Longimicrobiales bacterium]|nr:hypothetical protein [Longimicrobiales bacterium]
MTLHRADSTAVPLKYLAYWVKGAEGWRVAGYKRARSAEGEHPAGMMEPSLGQQGPETGSAVSWGADWVLVASSGDLGVTFGWIRLNQPLADGTLPPARPFFTIWRRAGPTEPWRYIAE